MKTFIRRASFIVVAILVTFALLIWVILPVGAAALGPALLRSAGVTSPDLAVKVVAGPGLLGGAVDSITVSSGPLDVDGRFTSDDATIVLLGANLTNNTFTSLTADATNPSATMASGETVTARWLHAEGPAADLVASARFSQQDLLAILALPQVVERVGFSTTRLTLGEEVALVTTTDGSFEATLSVRADGSLLLARNGGTPAVIWAAVGPDAADWHLTEVKIDPDGVTATAHFNAGAFLARYPRLLDLLGGFEPAP